MAQIIQILVKQQFKQIIDKWLKTQTTDCF